MCRTEREIWMDLTRRTYCIPEKKVSDKLTLNLVDDNP